MHPLDSIVSFCNSLVALGNFALLINKLLSHSLNIKVLVSELTLQIAHLIDKIFLVALKHVRCLLQFLLPR